MHMHPCVFEFKSRQPLLCFSLIQHAHAFTSTRSDHVSTTLTKRITRRRHKMVKNMWGIVRINFCQVAKRSFFFNADMAGLNPIFSFPVIALLCSNREEGDKAANPNHTHLKPNPNYPVYPFARQHWSIDADKVTL